MYDYEDDYDSIVGRYLRAKMTKNTCLLTYLLFSNSIPAIGNVLFTMSTLFSDIIDFCYKITKPILNTGRGMTYVIFGIY